ncbi:MULTISPECIES: formate dehydrogenase accessory sulfurtransferase FdhD [unclassified Microbacterium]|uniref:formate dehydrogenase accessory sulfurtransferase FdhD n=1 Tax=unclassified Microbacterium TaxID=2609290 RepID=UPI00214C1B39|nr:MULTISPECIES: formate dehydrogenase accessory sulfurtransferase FdhD [unclassified Microbacterium]MCR2810333.1 formate dehydrogenase accessory sulfurtransferase FdhD [Microbacterium sp. zg.B185]WIM18392.1 formate dehydrogenase accessory sulfurtransferase FdhD [Microbacterium sp. zg-B185]
MGRITVRRPVTKLTLGAEAIRRSDTLAVEEPLEIRVGGMSLAVTMRTPGNDVELAAGFLVSEGVISRGDQFRSAIHCGGPGTGGPITGISIGAPADGNTYNVLDVTLAPGVKPPDPELARAFYTTSSCGLCGKASIDAVETTSVYDVAGDGVTVQAAVLAGFPDALRARQAVFDKTGGLHAAALFDAVTGELLVLREDVGRHNAVDKVIGWAVLQDRLPLRGVVLQVSGRTSFELVQKAVMAGIPVLAAVSAPSSLAVELAASAGLTLIGFLRGPSMNIYTRDDRILEGSPEGVSAGVAQTAVESVRA